MYVWIYIYKKVDIVKKYLSDGSNVHNVWSGMEPSYWGAVYWPLPSSGAEQKSRGHQGQKFGLSIN